MYEQGMTTLRVIIPSTVESYTDRHSQKYYKFVPVCPEIMKSGPTYLLFEFHKI